MKKNSWTILIIILIILGIFIFWYIFSTPTIDSDKINIQATCLEDNDCVYVLNYFRMGQVDDRGVPIPAEDIPDEDIEYRPGCLNLDTVSDTSDLEFDENINCVCKEIEEGEDSGIKICQQI